MIQAYNPHNHRPHGGSVQRGLSAAIAAAAGFNVWAAADKRYSLERILIEGPFKSEKSRLSDVIVFFELLAVVVGLLAGCYFIATAAVSFYAAASFLKLFVLTAIVLVAAIFVVVLPAWRLVGVIVFAGVAPLLQYLAWISTLHY